MNCFIDKLNIYSDMPSSFEGLNAAQFNANDAKDQMMLLNNSTLDQIPKEISLATDSSDQISPPQSMPTDQMMKTQNVVGGSDGVTPENVAAVPVPAIVPVPQQPATSMENTVPVVAEPSKDLEAASPTKAAPVRKISRFLVSPAILTVANEKSVQNICVEEPIESPPPTTTTNASANIPTASNQATAERIEYHQMPIQNQVKYISATYLK